MKKHIYFIAVVLVVIAITFLLQTNRKRYILNEGFAIGTIYHIKYDSPEGKDLKPQIESVIQSVERSVSIFKEESIISKINKNDTTVEIDRHFERIFIKAEEISAKTNGAFDITIGPLVELWGFGKDKDSMRDSATVDSVRKFVGFSKVRIIGKKVLKENPQIQLNMNAIAKGYAVDAVAEFMELHDVENYMVEIGGEVRAKGVNKEDKTWRIGIDKPIDDPAANDRQIQDIIALKDKSVATSGNYRNFYIKDGKKYSHTISPYTGYPALSDMLGVSVLADDCLTADAYATAFMVLGVQESLRIVHSIAGLEAYFIFSDDKGQMQVLATDGMKTIMVTDAE